MKDQLSEDSQRRLEENPLRVLDSKEKEDKVAVEQAPSILDYLDEEAKRILMRFVGCWKTWGSPCHRYQYGAWLGLLQPLIFEFITEIEGNELTVCAGGRYDGLVEYFGGPATAGFGFGIGVERILRSWKERHWITDRKGLDAYIAVLGDEANEAALSLVQALRVKGFKAERDYLGRKLKAQFKSADVFAAKTLITLGSSEVESGQVTVKNNQTRQEVTVALESLKKDFPSVLAELGLSLIERERQGETKIYLGVGAKWLLLLSLFWFCLPTFAKIWRKAVKFSDIYDIMRRLLVKEWNSHDIGLPINTRQKKIL